MNDTTTDRILLALFCLSRDTSHIDATELARAAGVSATQAAQGLVALERAGLVDAGRARLTMLGLARAAKLANAASGGGQPRVDLQHAKPRTSKLAAPLAAAATLAPRAPADEREHPAYLSASAGSYVVGSA
jgi:DNA-binding IclR family transcriptional regulator